MQFKQFFKLLPYWLRAQRAQIACTMTDFAASPAAESFAAKASSEGAQAYAPVADSMSKTFYEAAQPAAEFVAKKFSEALQAYPSVAEYYEWTVSSATDAYANRPSVDEMFDLTRTTITQKAPWMVSQVESHMAKIIKQYEFTKVDKLALLVMLAISVLAILFITKKALAFLP